ncbi:pentapeptide repeat-containing protein [Chloroflexota bacterium]
MQCKYEYKSPVLIMDGKTRCHREGVSDRGFCLLHDDWKYKTREQAEQAFRKEIEKDIENYEGCILPEIVLSDRIFKHGLHFAYSKIEGDVWFSEAVIGGNVFFDGAAIVGNAIFNEAKIEGNVMFN